MRQCHRQTCVQATWLYCEVSVRYPRTQLGVRSFSCLCYPVKHSPCQKSAGIERAHVASTTYIQWWWKVQPFSGTRVSSIHWQGHFCPMHNISFFSEDVDEVLNVILTTSKLAWKSFSKKIKCTILCSFKCVISSSIGTEVPLNRAIRGQTKLYINVHHNIVW